MREQREGWSREGVAAQVTGGAGLSGRREAWRRAPEETGTREKTAGRTAGRRESRVRFGFFSFYYHQTNTSSPLRQMQNVTCNLGSSHPLSFGGSPFRFTH